MRNPSKKTIKHMARIVLFQNDSYNPIIRDIRKWENMNPKLARRERWRFYYVYQKILMSEKIKKYAQSKALWSQIRFQNDYSSFFNE